MSCKKEIPEIDKEIELELKKGNPDFAKFQTIFDGLNESDIEIPTMNFDASKQMKKTFWFDYDFRFWAIIPAINLNFHSGFRIEIEILCFQFYITFR